jgi:hypothetical protein
VAVELGGELGLELHAGGIEQHRDHRVLTDEGAELDELVLRGVLEDACEGLGGERVRGEQLVGGREERADAGSLIGGVLGCCRRDRGVGETDLAGPEVMVAVFVDGSESPRGAGGSPAPSRRARAVRA